MALRMVIVTGLSGAGKTQAVRALEDLGFFCVDNLPPRLMGKFIELCLASRREIKNVALVVDIRGGEFFDDLSDALVGLQQNRVKYEILFLEASDDVLLRRYKEARRVHPLSQGGDVLAGIRQEREKLRELRGRADVKVDTSRLSPAQLKEIIRSHFAADESGGRLRVTITSFGYKYGIPSDCDLLFDVRFLPNPHYQRELRPLTGNDRAVADYVLAPAITGQFMQKLKDLLQFLLPYYQAEGKAGLQIAVGCTGGRHRSVTIVNELARFLRQQGYPVQVQHRDIGQPAEGEICGS